MTSLASLFSTYSPCFGGFTSKVVDGSLSTIAENVSIFLSKNLTLNSVLHVLKLSCNLLYVNQLTKDLNCIVKFSHCGCEFQNLCLGKTISNARKIDGLYYLERNVIGGGQAQGASRGDISFSVDNQIMLWYYRLDHPSFTYSKLLFPFLFRNKNSSMFQCEICQLSKYHQVFFHGQHYKQSKPFSLVHSDI